MPKTIWLCGMLILAVSLLGGGSVQSALAQEGEGCRLAVDQAIASTLNRCGELVPGTLCVGSNPVVVTGKDGQPVSPAPAVSLTGIGSVATGGLTADDAGFGIGVFSILGRGSQGPLTAILYGDAVLVNLPGDPSGPACNAVSIGTVNIRAEPNTGAEVLGQLTVGQSAPITARLDNSSWWRIMWNGAPAWVFAELAPADCSPAAMVVVDPVSGALTGGIPAPDFLNVRLESSFDRRMCPAAPRGGVLVQSGSEGGSWRVNGLTLALHGTALLQAGANDVLVVQVLEGQAALEIGSVLRQAEAGQLIRVPLRGGSMESLPGPALDVLGIDAAAAPLSLLPRQVTPPAVAEALPVPPVGTDLVCDVLPQQMVVPVDGGVARVQIATEPGQTVRVSVSPDPLPANAAERSAQVSQQRTLLSLENLTAPDEESAMTYSINAASSAVTIGVTCDLPPVATLPEILTCANFLLDWRSISGNQVRFEAPAGARISVVATHGLPSAGIASTLEAVFDSEVVGQAPFASFDTQQTAGPLEFVAPGDGEYTIRWDGDPFNISDIEVICASPS